MMADSLLKKAVIFCFLTLAFSLSPAQIISGIDRVNALKGDEWNSPDTDWVNWIVVSVSPTRIHFPSWTDAQRQTFFDEFDPDHLDMWSGQAANRGDFFRMRGTAVNSPMEYEYQELIGSIYGHTDIFVNNGIARKEDGSWVKRFFRPDVQPPCMCHLAPFWHEVVKQGILRTGVYGDSMFQDNIANPIYTWGQGFCDWCNRGFITYMKERFSLAELKRLGFDDTFNIRRYIAFKRRQLKETQHPDQPQYFQEQQRSNTVSEKLLDVPIIQEYIRFQHIRNLELLVESASELKKTAIKMGRPVPAFYGNIPHVSGMRAFPTIMAGQVDIIWTEVSSNLQPPFKAGRQAWSALQYKTGRAAGSFEKPLICVQYHGGHSSAYEDAAQKRLPTALACSEALGSGGIPCQTWAVTEYYSLMKNEGWEAGFRNIHRQHAAFATANRALFTDRSGLAETALVYSFPDTFWRQFQSLSADQPHLNHFTAAARMLENAHIPYEVLITGHPDVFDDSKLWERLDRYRTIVIPAAECVSNTHIEKLSRWVKDGGTLVLWGAVAGRDEELKPRKTPGFASLMADAGKGRVREIDAPTADLLCNGRMLCQTSEKSGQQWRYTVQEPDTAWTSTGFDDMGWQTGIAPFGNKTVRGCKPNTDWTGEYIWLRREFNLDKLPEVPVIYLHHLWDVEIYVNGRLIAAEKGRGHPFETYQLLDIRPGMADAFTAGKNLMAVKCRKPADSATSEQFIDVGLIDLLDERPYAALFQSDNPMLETDLPSSVWLNVWRHGAGPMVSVQMVNYNLDVRQDEMTAETDFTVRLRIPEGVNWQQVAYWANDFEDRPVIPQTLSFKKNAGYAEVVVPSLKVFGVLVFSDTDELDARLAAGQARKYLERLKIARRCPGAAIDADTAAIQKAELDLAVIHGGQKVDTFMPLILQYKAMAADLEERLNNTTHRVVAYQNRLCDAALQAPSVRRFDFGDGTVADGWTQVKTTTAYSNEQGYGWVDSNPKSSFDRQYPDAVHGDFIRNVTVEENPELLAVKLKQPQPWPLLQPQNNPGVFQVDLENGHYIVTVITGDYSEFPIKSGPQNEGRTAMTVVHANGVLKLLGDTLHSGYFENRAFDVDVTEGKLVLEFSGTNIGPLYSNSIEWLVNGVLIQKKEQPATAAASAYMEWQEVLNRSAIREWLILGPFEDTDYTGLDDIVGPEAQLSQGFPFGQDVSAWRSWRQEDNEAPRVPLHDIMKLETAKGIGFAFVRMECPQDTEALLVTSTTQYAKGYLNGVLIYRDGLAIGLTPQEELVPIKLKKGQNDLLIKTVNHWGNEWSFWAGVLSLDKKPLPELKVILPAQ